jgi:hypothetical protein
VLVHPAFHSIVELLDPVPDAIIPMLASLSFYSRIAEDPEKILRRKIDLPFYSRIAQKLLQVFCTYSALILPFYSRIALTLAGIGAVDR